MNEEEIINNIRRFVQNSTDSNKIHGFGHTERVYNMCIYIGHKLQANLFLLRIAALLHDTGRYTENFNQKNKNHAEVSAEIALKYINTSNFPFQKSDIENIYHSIQSHSFSNKITPKTLEAKILSDADKLDALGAIGLYRTIGFTIKNNGNLHDVINHLENKIFKLREMLFLDISKKIAQKRLEILNLFYKEIKSEI